MGIIAYKDSKISPGNNTINVRSIVMVEDLRWTIEFVKTLMQSVDGQVLLVYFGILLFPLIFVSIVGIIFGTYSTVVLVKQLANEPRPIPVISTLYYVIGRIGTVITCAFLSLFLLPLWASGDPYKRLDEYFEPLFQFLNGLNDTSLLILSIIIIVFIILYSLSAVIAFFETIYTFFNPGKVRDQYSSDVGKSIVTHRGWIVWPYIIGIAIDVLGLFFSIAGYF